MDLPQALSLLDACDRKADGRVYIRDVDKICKQIGRNHDLAQQLWSTGQADARELAVRSVEPAQVTEALLDSWVADLDEWGLCDAFAGGVVAPSSWAHSKILTWAKADPEFTKRAAFATIAQLAWRQNDVPDTVFEHYLTLIEMQADDSRYYVKKAINWALRDIGKRNTVLRDKARTVVQRLQTSTNRTARWVGTHRMRELGA